jgi:hypothetical protein
MYQTLSERPGAQQRRPWNPQPGRLNPQASTGHVRDRLQFAATQAKVRALESDWLFQSLSAEGQRRMLVEHGLIPR